MRRSKPLERPLNCLEEQGQLGYAAVVGASSTDWAVEGAPAKGSRRTALPRDAQSAEEKEMEKCVWLCRR